jgi:hypothetical protein
MAMECDEALSKLEDLVDGELSLSEEEALRAHLSNCLSCGEAEASLARLKRLVVEKVRKPQAPGNLHDTILKGFEKELKTQPAEDAPGPSRAGRRYRVAALAAVLVVSCSLAAIFLFDWAGFPFKKLNHAEAASACAEAFRSVLPPRPSSQEQRGWKEKLIAEIAEKTGTRLDHVPDIPQATYLRWEPQTVKNLKGIRIDFQPIEDGSPVDGARDAAQGSQIISVYFLPLKRMDFRCSYLKELESGHPCTHCIQLKDGSIYCLRTDNFFLSVVSNLEEGELLARHCPTCK